MQDLEGFKRALGPEAEEYTEPQLEELRRQMYGLADLLLDIYLGRRQERKAGSEDIDSLGSGATLKAERSKNKISLG